jgi:hypothetical protein
MKKKPAPRRGSGKTGKPAQNPMLIGELVNQYRGPILVIGGGPSALADLHELRVANYDFKTVLSANEHGHRQTIYRIGFTVAADGVHHAKRQRMNTYIESLGVKGVPMISPAWFADYRLPDWKLASNTGLTAIAIAAALGGGPIVVTGLDFYRLEDKGAATYFHDEEAESDSNKKTRSNFEDQIEALHARIGTEQQIRPMSGPLLGMYPRWNPYEKRKPGPLPEFARYAYRMDTHLMRSHRSVRWNLCAMQVDPDVVVACSALEARAAHRAALEVGIRPSPASVGGGALLQTSVQPA